MEWTYDHASILRPIVTNEDDLVIKRHAVRYIHPRESQPNCLPQGGEGTERRTSFVGSDDLLLDFEARFAYRRKWLEEFEILTGLDLRRRCDQCFEPRDQKD